MIYVLLNLFFKCLNVMLLRGRFQDEGFGVLSPTQPGKRQGRLGWVNGGRGSRPSFENCQILECCASGVNGERSCRML